MKLIVGLGNPDEAHKNNRHNVGFIVVDALASQISNSQFQVSNEKSDSNFEYQKKHQSNVLKLNDLLLAKPQTFMNESGETVASLATYYKLPTTSIYVIHDDLDIEIGEFKIQKDKGPKDHNGLNSIYEKLGSKDFWHVRVGVENRDKENKIPGEKYVLQNFTKEELETIENVIDNVIRELSKHVFT